MLTLLLLLQSIHAQADPEAATTDTESVEHLEANETKKKAHGQGEM